MSSADNTDEYCVGSDSWVGGESEKRLNRCRCVILHTLDISIKVFHLNFFFPSEWPFV